MRCKLLQIVVKPATDEPSPKLKARIKEGLALTSSAELIARCRGATDLMKAELAARLGREIADRERLSDEVSRLRRQISRAEQEDRE